MTGPFWHAHAGHVSLGQSLYLPTPKSRRRFVVIAYAPGRVLLAPPSPDNRQARANQPR